MQYITLNIDTWNAHALTEIIRAYRAIYNIRAIIPDSLLNGFLDN